MQTMREAWTDERLDDLSQRMDCGFDRVDRDVRELRGVVSSLQSEMTKRFDATQRLLVQVAVGLGTAMVTGFVALATLIATGG